MPAVDNRNQHASTSINAVQMYFSHALIGLDADLNLNFGSSTQLTGLIDLEWVPLNGHGLRVNDYILVDSNLSVNGAHVGTAFGNQAAFSFNGTTVELFVPSGSRPAPA